MTFTWHFGLDSDTAASVNAAIEARFQPLLDELLTACAGLPVAAVRTEVASRWAEVNRGGDHLALVEPEATEVAQAISAGHRVFFRDGLINVEPSQ